MPVGIALKEKCTLILAIKQIIHVKSVDSCDLDWIRKRKLQQIL